MRGLGIHLIPTDLQQLKNPIEHKLTKFGGQIGAFRAQTRASRRTPESNAFALRAATPFYPPLPPLQGGEPPAKWRAPRE